MLPNLNETKSGTPTECHVLSSVVKPRVSHFMDGVFMVKGATLAFVKGDAPSQVEQLLKLLKVNVQGPFPTIFSQLKILILFVDVCDESFTAAKVLVIVISLGNYWGSFGQHHILTVFVKVHSW